MTATTECSPCATAAKFGAWMDSLPKGAGTHCSTCHVSYPGSQKWGHCVTCHQMFASVSAFDRHQMVAECPQYDGTVSDIAHRVNVALSEYAAAQMEDGKRHYLVQDHNPLGFDFWRWNR